MAKKCPDCGRSDCKCKGKKGGKMPMKGGMMKSLVFMFMLLSAGIALAADAIAPAAAPTAKILGLDPTMFWAIAASVFACASEIIGMLPIKSNGVVQLLLNIGGSIFAKK